MAVKIISAVLLAAAVCIHLISCGRDNVKIRRISKIFLVPLIILVYVSFCDTFSFKVLIALLLGWLGDMLLIFSSEKIMQALGIVSFGAGHVFYVWAMHSLFRPLPVWVYIVIPAGVIAAEVFAYSRVSKYIGNDMRAASVIYYLLLTSITASGAFVLAGGNIAGVFMLAAGLLFSVSDSFLVFCVCAAGEDRGPYAVIVMSTYIAAQVLFAVGFIL